MYNSEINMVEESINIKFDGKEPDSQMSELIASFAEIELTEKLETSSVPKRIYDALELVDPSDGSELLHLIILNKMKKTLKKHIMARERQHNLEDHSSISHHI